MRNFIGLAEVAPILVLSSLALAMAAALLSVAAPLKERLATRTLRVVLTLSLGSCYVSGLTLSGRQQEIWATTARLQRKSMSLLLPFFGLAKDRRSRSTLYGQEDGDDNESRKLLILGLGRVGQELADVVMKCDGLNDSFRFSSVLGTTRQEIERSNITILSCNWDSLLPHVDTVTHVLVTIPPQDELTYLFNRLVEQGRRIRWWGVLSTTGVYGNHDNAWVTEESECRSENNDPACSAQQFLEYEAQWQQRIWSHNQGLINARSKDSDHDKPLPVSILRIFRCAGIYGPDQSALHTLYRRLELPPAGKPSEQASPSSAVKAATAHNEGQITNRIHQHDIARAIASCMARDDQLLPNSLLPERSAGSAQPPAPSCNWLSIYNLADDCPESRDVVFAFARGLFEAQSCMRLGQPPEPAGPRARISLERAKRRRRDQKRVSNAKMKRELISELKYPTFREGLASIFSNPAALWWTRDQGGT
jgi:nucleoside-diphosphate-sugar epimerase